MFIVIDDLGSLRPTSQIFCRMSLSLCLLDVLLMISLGLQVFQRRTVELKGHCCHVRSVVDTIQVICHC